ncbi:MAG TPA: hypothetical protein VGJ14_07695 [Sporichthyaceae bacterium]|jgi:Na+/proline symporter
MRGRLFLALVAVLVLCVLFSRGDRRRGHYLAGKARRLRRAFLIATAISVLIDAVAIASGGVSGARDVCILLATTAVPFTYLYWRFGGSFKFRRE